MSSSRSIRACLTPTCQHARSVFACCKMPTCALVMSNRLSMMLTKILIGRRYSPRSGVIKSSRGRCSCCPQGQRRSAPDARLHRRVSRLPPNNSTNHLVPLSIVRICLRMSRLVVRDAVVINWVATVDVDVEVRHLVYHGISTHILYLARHCQ